jgi:hypothetical protein
VMERPTEGQTHAWVLSDVRVGEKV